MRMRSAFRFVCIFAIVTAVVGVVALAVVQPSVSAPWSTWAFIFFGAFPAWLGELRGLIIALPVADWPYGRVVLASDIEIRAPDRSDDQQIKQNHDAADRILKALGITIDWWPS